MADNEQEKPLADEIPPRYLKAAKDQIAKQLAKARQTRDKDIIRKWEAFEKEPEKYAFELWRLEHPSAHAFVKNKPALDLLDALRTKELDVNEFSHGFTDEERAYLEKRKSEYIDDYDFNKSSDAIMLRTTLVLELHLNQQLIMLQYDPEGSSKILDRVNTLTEMLRKQHDSLKALRKQRVPDPPPTPKPAKSKSEMEQAEDPLIAITQRYVENENRADILQAQMDAEKEEFLKRRKERQAIVGVNENESGEIETDDFFDTEDD